LHLLRCIIAERCILHGMPAKNVIREFAPDNYYHVYNRGVAKQPVFLDAQDKQKFLHIIERHLDPDNAERREDGQIYRKFDQDLELLSYCLMGNHFHMLIYLVGNGDRLAEFMRSVCTAYTMYFNKRYKRVGGLFQGVYKARCISSDAYLLHITRYIHLNPRTFRTYKFSSVAFYLDKTPPVWLRPNRVREMLAG